MPIPWHVWAPPLDPPVDGGLPDDVAEQIAAAYWAADPWECLALMWTAYALTLPPEATVASVSTGVQSVSYAEPGGPFAIAMARADWFREQNGTLASVPLRAATDARLVLPPDWWQRDLEDRATWERAFWAAVGR